MKHICVIWFGEILACCLAACAGHDGWTLEGKISFSRYTSVLLTDEAYHPLDSMPLRDGSFRMELPGEVEHPYPVVLRFVNREDADDVMEMPLMVENGTVRLDIGEYVRVGGTPLNDALQEFLNGLQDCKEHCARQTELGAEEVEKLFSAFYLQQISIHRRDTLGAYLFRQYGIHLDERDGLEARKLLNID